MRGIDAALPKLLWDFLVTVYRQGAYRYRYLIHTLATIRIVQ